MKKMVLVFLLVLSLSSCGIRNDHSTDTSNYIDTYNFYDVNKESYAITFSEKSESNSNKENEVVTSENAIITPIIEPVNISGLYITVEELMPIIETARYNMYLIDGGDEIFNLEDGRYVSFNQKDFYAVIYSFYDVFSNESKIADKFFSSLICYKSGKELLIERGECPNFTKVKEDIFNISNSYEKVTIDGGIGANPTYLNNEFEIIDRTETTIILKNTAYYSEENDEPIQVFEYSMVLEDGTWKFNNFERWY